jgi:hypothetical protein
MTTLGLVVLAKNAQELGTFCGWNPRITEETDELALVANPGRRFGGLGAIANRYFRAFQSDVVGIVHGDTYFPPGALTEFAEEAEKYFALTGLVGRRLDGYYLWAKDTHAIDPFLNTRIEALPGNREVSTLDGCAVFFPKRLDLRFDADTFDSFHLCVEDLCLQAASRKIVSLVPHVPGCEHRSGEQKAPWLAAHALYYGKLVTKWDGKTFRTT